MTISLSALGWVSTAAYAEIEQDGHALVLCHYPSAAGRASTSARSPVDLIPDFIPVIGYLDDLLIVPLGIWAASKLIPAVIMTDARLKALEQGKPTSWAGLLAIVFIWIATVGLAAWLIPICFLKGC